MTQIEFLVEAAKQGVSHSIQYVDYPPDTWTTPVLLTQERLARLMDDNSVKRIRLEFNIK